MKLVAARPRTSAPGCAARPSPPGSASGSAICFGICFVTGLISHYAQNVDQPIPFPTSPSWGYRVTQGLHVITGTAAVPLLLVKLWTVFPRLFLRPPRGARRLLLEALERGSIAVLVAAAIFQLASGLANAAQWYPWSFSFRSTHYALAWIAIGALRGAHRGQAADHPRRPHRRRRRHDARPRRRRPSPACCRRRGLLRTTWGAAGRRGARDRRQHGAAPARRLGPRRPLRRRARRDPDQQVRRGRARSPPTATRARLPAHRGVRRPRDRACPATTCSRCRSRPAPCRSPASRAGARAAPGPASSCGSCSTLVEAPAGAEVRVVSLQESRPLPADRAAGQLRRRRPHPARAGARGRAARPSTTATRPG